MAILFALIAVALAYVSWLVICAIIDALLAGGSVGAAIDAVKAAMTPAGAAAA